MGYVGLSLGVALAAGLSGLAVHAGAPESAKDPKIGTTRPGAGPVFKGQVPLVMRTRKSVTALSATELASLRRGFAQMIAWNSAPRTSANFRRSLRFWANMHGYFGSACGPVSDLSEPGMSGLSAQSETNPEETTTWCTCKHNSNDFLTWHRMYVYYFEQVLRQASGDPNLTLPYWDYQTNAHIPAAYRAQTYVLDGNTVANPLYVANRQSDLNDGSETLSDSVVAVSAAMSATSYLPFNDALEQTPHGAVHCATGVDGCGSGYMGSVPAAGNDPIFYSHHANIDRLYECWLKGDQAARLPTGTVVTKTFSFINGSGNMVGRQVSDMLTTEQLRYKYTSGGGCPVTLRIPKIIWREIPWRVVPILGPTPFERGVTRAPVKLPSGLRAQIFTAPDRPAVREATLVIDGLAFEQAPRVMYEVVLEGRSGKRVSLGVLNFFADTAHDHKQAQRPGERRFPATEALRELGGDEGTLVLVPTTGVTGASVAETMERIGPRANLRFAAARLELR